MHIVICVNEFPPGPGGIAAQAFALASYFSARGFRVSVLTAQRPGFNSEVFDNNQSFNLIRYGTDESVFIKIAVHVKFFWQHRQSITHIFLSGSAQQFLTLFIPLFCCAKIISILHGHEISMKKGLLRSLIVKALSRSNQLVTVSQFSQLLLLEGLRNHGKEVDIQVIPNGINLKSNNLASKPSLKKTLKLITVGSITLRKGQLNVVRALPYINKLIGPVEYHLVGMPVEFNLLQKTALELNVQGLLYVHGVLPEAEKDELINNSHIFLMLSENLPNGDVEGFGIAVLEANAFGIPAIGSRNTGLEDSVKDGFSGLLVNPHDPCEIANAIQKIVKRYNEYSRNSRTWAESHDWQILLPQYLDLLQK
ncbi:MAG: glycosyltransferase family 4 protein [Chitinophagales bacterium]|nr:glycosyltransferase family 4 protein [Chitinophagales bacterium]